MGLFSGGYSGGIKGFFEEASSYVTTGKSAGMASSSDVKKHQEKVIESIRPKLPKLEDLLPEAPHAKLQRQLKEIAEKHRKDIEEVADKINPLCGNTIKKLNNLGDTVENTMDSARYGLLRKIFSFDVKELKISDHLFVQRVGYTHHGLYLGNGEVAHYLAHAVTRDSLETFADGAKINKKSDSESPISYTKNEVISRAYRRLSESNYNLFFNNCESFVRWCRNGAEG